MDALKNSIKSKLEIDFGNIKPKNANSPINQWIMTGTKISLDSDNILELASVVTGGLIGTFTISFKDRLMLIKLTEYCLTGDNEFALFRDAISEYVKSTIVDINKKVQHLVQGLEISEASEYQTLTEGSNDVDYNNFLTHIDPDSAGKMINKLMKYKPADLAQYKGKKVRVNVRDIAGNPAHIDLIFPNENDKAVDSETVTFARFIRAFGVSYAHGCYAQSQGRCDILTKMCSALVLNSGAQGLLEHYSAFFEIKADGGYTYKSLEKSAGEVVRRSLEKVAIAVLCCGLQKFRIESHHGFDSFQATIICAFGLMSDCLIIKRSGKNYKEMAKNAQFFLTNFTRAASLNLIGFNKKVEVPLRNRMFLANVPSVPSEPVDFKTAFKDVMILMADHVKMSGRVTKEIVEFMSIYTKDVVNFLHSKEIDGLAASPDYIDDVLKSLIR